MFKKKNKIKYAFLKRLSFLRANHKSSFFHSLYMDNKRTFLSNLSSIMKSVDLKYRSSLIWYNNRKFFKKFFFLTKIRQIALTRFLSNLLKSSQKYFLKYLQFSICNVLIYCKFVFTKLEAKMFLKHGLVYVNGLKIEDYRTMLSVGDRLQLILNDKIYHFYKHNFHSKSKMFKGLSYRIWVLNRFKFNFYKQSTTKIPNIYENVYFFYEDVPVYFEVDYILLMCCIIYDAKNFNHFSFFIKKTVNFVLLRHYN